MQEGMSFQLHVRDSSDLDTPLPVDAFVNQQVTKEGVLTLLHKHLSGVEIVGFIGPSLEPDGAHHIYLLVRQRNKPMVTGTVLYPGVLGGP